jgi:lysophospholipase L1-like esterase
MLATVLLSACAIGLPTPPTDVSDTGATLNGNVHSNFGDTDYWWRYGETTAYGNETPHHTVAISQDRLYAAHPVSEAVAGLTPATTYHFQLCTQDQQESPGRIICSKDQTLTTAAQPKPPPKLYVAMGDSVTQWGATDRYPERFFNSLDEAGEADILQNIGESGQTSAGLNGNQLTGARQLIDDPASDATVVSIDIGGNDILFFGEGCNPQGGSGFNLTTCQSTLDQFSTNFTATLDALNESLADDPGTEQLLVMTYYNPWSGRPGEPDADNNGDLVLRGTDRTLDCDGTGEQLGLNDRLACIGADHQGKLADAYPPFIGHGLNNGSTGDYMSDNIHPNEAGHQVIAETFETAFWGQG